MQFKDVLQRITQKRDELGLSDAEISTFAGSKDLVRNWRRAEAKGQTVSMRHAALEQIARRLDVSLTWLTEGTEGITAPQQPRGFAEGIQPFTLQPSAPNPNDHASTALLRAIFGHKATSPASHLLTVALPGFGLSAGDVIIVDMARLPEVGEITMVTVFDDAAATSETKIMRLAPPFLLSGSASIAEPYLRCDDPAVTIRYPIIGALRGLAPAS